MISKELHDIYADLVCNLVNQIYVPNYDQGLGLTRTPCTNLAWHGSRTHFTLLENNV
jgi:hypothetical protein